MEALQTLGIDVQGLILYLVNFGLLALVATWLIYKPVLRLLDKRRDTIKGNLEEADKLRNALEEARVKHETDTQHAARKMEQEIAEAKAHAQTKSKELIADAQTQKDDLLKEAKAIIDEMKKRIHGEVEDEVKEKMTKVLLHVLSSKVPEKAVKESVEVAWKEMNV